MMTNSKRINCPIGLTAVQVPNAPALITSNETISFQNLEQMITGTTEFFQERGINSDYRVAMMGPPSVSFIVSLFSLWRIGAAAVPFNPRFPGSYIRKLLNKTSSAFFILEETNTDAYYRDVDIIGWNDIIEAASSDTKPSQQPAQITPENDAAIILTSGSTSREKAVLLTYGNLYFNALGSNENLPLSHGDRWLLSLPLFHVGGLGILFRCMLAGAAIVLPDIDEMLHQSITKFGITHVSMVSTQLIRLLETIKPGTGSLPLKAILLGGGAFPAPLIQRAAAIKLPVLRTYGLSETASQVTTTPPNDSPDHLSTSGKCLPYRELKVNRNNEICVRGKTLFKGYVEEHRLEPSRDREGWFTTGDLGRLDNEGYLQVLGRRDNMFISGGENIMPEAIEAILNQFPGIRQSLVVPVEDETYGHRPAAFLQIEAGTEITRSSLIDYLEMHLPRFKIPDQFYRWPKEEPGRKSLKIKRPHFLKLIRQPETQTLLFNK
jgi:o-succinylbenzoate---CoA ligase